MEKKPLTPRQIVERLDQYIVGQAQCEKSGRRGIEEPLQKKSS